MDERKNASRLLIIAIVILCGAGGWISGQLVQEHADLWSGGGSGGGLFERVCRATASLGLDCTSPHKSPWAEISVPVLLPTRDYSLHLHRVIVPVAFLGLAYFVFLATWFVFVGRPHARGGGWQRAPLVVGFVGATVSLVYLAVMVVGLAPACMWCAAVHAVNLLTVLAIRRLYRRYTARPSTKKSRAAVPFRRHTSVVLMMPASRQAAHAVVFALIIIAGLWFYRHEQLALGHQLRTLVPYKRLVTALRNDPSFLLREHYAQPWHRIPARPDEHATEDQPQLIVFTDFECPSCYCHALWLRKKASDAFNGQLTVAIRHYPLCEQCNSAVTGSAHRNSCAAAYVAEAARLQGGEAAFQKMHDLLFENRKSLGAALYSRLAVSIGLDEQRFLRDFAGDAVRRIVRKDVALARELGVEGTPTTFFNGRRITAFGRDNPVFWRAVAKDWSALHGRIRVATGLGTRD